MLKKFDVIMEHIVSKVQTVHVEIDIDENDDTETVCIAYAEMIGAAAMEAVDMTPDLWEERNSFIRPHLITGV